MATQKPGEWANSLLARFEEQVREYMQVKNSTQTCPKNFHDQ